MPYPYALCSDGIFGLWGEQAPLPTGIFGLSTEEEATFKHKNVILELFR